MLKSIKTKLQKTPNVNSSSIVREVENFDMKKIMPTLSSYVREGVFGFEIFSNKYQRDFLMITPSFVRDTHGKEMVRDVSYLKNSLKDLQCYSIILAKPSFLPIYTEEPYPLLEMISSLQLGENELFVQLLFSERKDNWRDDFSDQYVEFLLGNEFPANSRLGRKFQKKILNLIQRITKEDYRRENIDDIEYKIMDFGYRFELRVVAYTKDDQALEVELQEILNEYNHFNELMFIKIKKDKATFIDHFLNMRFSDLSSDQLISEAELSVITSGTVQKKEVIVRKAETPIQVQRNLEILPIGKKKDRKIDEGIIKEIPAALKKARAIRDEQIIIDDIELGATVQRVTFDIPEGKTYSDIKNKYNDIKTALGTEMSIIPGHEANTITFLIPCKEREVIYLRELLENPEFMKFAQENPLPFVCGIDMFNQPVYKCLTKGPHLLVTGQTNSGKSYFINALLITLILFKDPDELRLILIDPKMVELVPYEGIPHVEEVITDMEKSFEVLSGLVDEMERRYEVFSKFPGVRNIVAYNKKAKERMPYIVCAIDEYADLKETNDDVEDEVKRLGAKARAAGIHLIVATQRPSSKVITGDLKSNLPSRICFSLSTGTDYQTVFGHTIPHRLMGFGDGVVSYVAQTEQLIRFQAPVVVLDDEEEEEKVFEGLKNLKGGVIEGLNISGETVAVEEPIEKLKRIIARTGETRVKELQKEMGIGINKVTKMLKDLVDEGWLGQENRKYIVIATEEELEEYNEDY